MTVAELIIELKKLPQNTIVMIATPPTSDYSTHNLWESEYVEDDNDGYITIYCGV